MSLLKRVRDITAASMNEQFNSTRSSDKLLNDLSLDRCENPVHAIDKFLAAQRQQIQQAEAWHQQAVHHADSLRTQFLTAQQMKEKREKQAMIALKADEEDLARIALQEKISQEEKYEQYKALYEQTAQSISEMDVQLKRLKADYDTVYGKREYYAARLESVRLQQKLNERLDGSVAYTGSSIFYRIEERVKDLELETMTLGEIRAAGQQAVHKLGNVLHQSGTALQQALEQELHKLRNKLEQGGWTSP